MNPATTIGKPLHGVSYYPDLWPVSEIDRDITLMRELGINMVRMGDFAWAKMEPSEGKISLDFHLRVMDKLHVAGIATVFCTPTAGPPIWLTHNHPERCFTLTDGTPMSHGSRQHASYDHPYVRTACMRIVEAIGRSVGHHPGLIALQIDNELKCHVDQDFNEFSIKAWHAWLEKRFRTIDQLNEAWCTGIWSMRYERFDQVPAPRPTPFAHSPSLTTAWQEFTYERIAEFCDEQAAILRKHSSVPITHNTHLYFPLNFERIFRNMDFASFDDYPNSAQYPRLLMQCDMLRAAKPGKSFWVMETSVAHNGWSQNHEPAHPKGYLAPQAIACYASGAQTVAYWLWRQMRAGAEMPHSAILSSWGKPALGFDEVKDVTRRLNELSPLLSNSVPAPTEVAVTWSDTGRMMMRSEPLGMNVAHKIDYTLTIEKWHRLLLEAGLPRDVRFETASLKGLRLLITPYMPSVTEAFLKQVRAFVEQGGVWIAGPLTGHRTSEQTVPLEAGLGKLEEFAGVETVYSFPISGTGASGEALGAKAPLSGWCVALRARDDETRVIGKIGSGPADGLAFITDRPVGRGRVVLISAEPQGEQGEAMLSSLIAHCAEVANVTHRYQATRGTVVFPRVKQSGRRAWIVINLDGKGGTVTLSGKATDIVSGKPIDAGDLTLTPYDVRAVDLD
ncbi:MAG: beta-galactosidase [Burkholderiales bacterium]|nr:beta-galactosidase [Phycisphaerae bacterium]